MLSLFRTHPEAEKHILKFWRAWLEKKYGRPSSDAGIPRSKQEKHANDFALFAVEIHHEFVKRAVTKRVAFSAEKTEIENGKMYVNSLFFQFRDQKISAVQIE